MHPLPAFFEPKDLGQRPWGTEEVAALVPGVASLKVLNINAGHKGRLQRHHRKDEAGHLMFGEMIVRWLQGEVLMERKLIPGDSFHFPKGCVHQEEAVTDCVVLEVSTPFCNDRQGMEAEAGLEVPDDALPSTSPEDVTELEPWW